MLDLWIVEELKRLRKQDGRDNRPSLRVPMYPPPPREEPEDKDPEKSDRGVIIIGGDDDPNVIQM